MSHLVQKAARLTHGVGLGDATVAQILRLEGTHDSPPAPPPQRAPFEEMWARWTRSNSKAIAHLTPAQLEEWKRETRRAYDGKAPATAPAPAKPKAAKPKPPEPWSNAWLAIATPEMKAAQCKGDEDDDEDLDVADERDKCAECGHVRSAHAFEGCLAMGCNCAGFEEPRENTMKQKKSALIPIGPKHMGMTLDMSGVEVGPSAERVLGQPSNDDSARAAAARELGVRPQDLAGYSTSVLLTMSAAHKTARTR